jgi:hypothetical protein
MDDDVLLSQAVVFAYSKSFAYSGASHDSIHEPIVFAIEFARYTIEILTFAHCTLVNTDTVC